MQEIAVVPFYPKKPKIPCICRKKPLQFAHNPSQSRTSRILTKESKWSAASEGLISEWEGMVDVERCVAKDSCRKCGSEIFRSPFFDRFF
jgi:hypothetical protein